MMRVAVFAALFLGAPLGALPQDPSFSEVRFHRVHLRNGNFIDGQLVGEDGGTVTIRIKVGDLALRRDQVDRVELVCMRVLNERPAPSAKAKMVREQGPPAAAPSAAPPEPGRDSEFPGDRSVPETARKRVDFLLGRWDKSLPGDRELRARELSKVAPEALPYLAWLLEKRRDQVPVGLLCDALARTKDPAAGPILESVMRSTSGAHRAAAVKGLVEWDREEGIRPLLDALGDDAPDVWKPASQYLVSKARERGVPRLAEEVLGRMRRAGVKKAGFLQTLAVLDDPEARREVEEVLRRGEIPEKHDVLQALAARASPDDAPLVLPLLEESDRGILQSASVFLGRLKHRPAAALLVPLLESGDPGIVSNAHWALRQISGLNYGPDASLWRSWLEKPGNAADVTE